MSQDKMTLTLNGKETEVAVGVRLGKLVARLNLKGPVAAQVNDDIVQRDDIDGYLLSPGDRVEIFLMMGGG